MGINSIVQEKIDNILAQEYIGTKTHIIFEIKDAIGTACVYESADGFVWERSSPYLVLSPSDLNDSIYVQILNLGDNNDTSFTHLVGKAYDSSAEKIIVEGDGSVHELEISSNQFFYYKSSVPLHQLRFSYKSFREMSNIEFGHFFVHNVKSSTHSPGFTKRI